MVPLWFSISVIGAGVKLLVHMVAVAKKILGLGILTLYIGTVICYQDWLQAAYSAFSCFNLFFASSTVSPSLVK